MPDNITSRKPLVPYGKKLNKRAGDTVFILAGDGFRRAAPKVGHCVVLEPDADPFQFKWPVSGCGVILLDDVPLSENQAQTLALALHHSGAECSIWHDRQRQCTSWLMAGSAGNE